MCKVLLLSHGNLARELLATSQMIYGEVDGIDCISLLSGMDLAHYEEEILSKVQQSPEGILVLVDIFGGTPFITASRIYNQNQGKIDMAVVTGMNLPMVLEAMDSLQNMSVLELKESVIKCGAEGIIDLDERV